MILILHFFASFSALDPDDVFFHFLLEIFRQEGDLTIEILPQNPDSASALRPTEKRRIKNNDNQKLSDILNLY